MDLLQNLFLHLFLQSKSNKRMVLFMDYCFGKIKGFNGILIPTPQHQDASEKQNSSVAWIHDALFITHKTDALMIEFNPQNRTASAIVKTTLLKICPFTKYTIYFITTVPLHKNHYQKGENYASHHTTTSRSRHNTW